MGESSQPWASHSALRFSSPEHSHKCGSCLRSWWPELRSTSLRRILSRPSSKPANLCLMSDELRDRLSTNPKSPYYDEEILKREVGIRFNGTEKTNVEEYCVSEGWIRVALGKKFDRHGNPLLMKLNGVVEPYFKDEPSTPTEQP